MKIRLISLIMLSAMLPCLCPAQVNNADILMTVDGRPTEAGEFVRMYKKSLDTISIMPVDDYLDSFVIFKLKVADAMHRGYDTTASFRKELNGYRNQLAQNYLTDKGKKEQLIRQAYQRSLKEINAWHILVALLPNTPPKDTLYAWKKAMEVRRRILNGEPFEQVARSTSDDKSARLNGGNLGYVTVFQLIMPLEDAVYSLRKGAVSGPVRTPYGYHIIRVTDIRPSRGRIKVAHIMKNAAPGTDEKNEEEAEAEINDIYLKLKQGLPFGELAKEYSDHRESASKGGELNWFGAGEMIPEFSEKAFAIADTGEYTEPFRTLYGWHIVKLLQRKPPGTFEETRSFIESRINQSYLNMKSKNAFVAKLKSEYGFKINKASLDWFIRNTDSLITGGLRKYDRSSVPEGAIFIFADQAEGNNEFADRVENKGPLMVIKDSSELIRSVLEGTAAERLISYENSMLEKKYPEFRYLMTEFHDGILLFDISNDKVWNRVSSDSAGLHEFYEANKYNYLTRKEFEAKIYTLKKPGEEKALAAAYRKYSCKEDCDNRLLTRFNKKEDTLLTIRNESWEAGSMPELENSGTNNGVQMVTIGGLPSLIVLNKTTEPLPLPFEMVQEEMISGYQEYLEKEWTGQLKEDYSVTIDSLILHEIKEKLIHE